jgi:hypothetical protein
MSLRDGKTPHCADMPRQTQFELPTRQIPDLNDSVAGSRREPLVPWFHSDTAHPSQMSRNNALELPFGVVLGLDGVGLLV